MVENLDEGQIEFKEVAPPEPCSYNECPVGHRWAPLTAVSYCQGCGGPALAIQKTNCPICNEPIVKTVLRSDFVPRGAGLAQRCKKQPVAGESMDLIMERHMWQEIEDLPMKTFEDKKAEEVKGLQ